LNQVSAGGGVQSENIEIIVYSREHGKLRLFVVISLFVKQEDVITEEFSRNGTGI
jgi:hypothetical protein